jgi:hypothetical protein
LGSGGFFVCLRVLRGEVRGALALVLVALAGGACDYGAPAPASATSPSPVTPGSTSLTYVKDIQPMLASDCVRCHGPSRRDAGVDVSTYANVMRYVVPGSSASLLILVTRQGGIMYGEFRGSASQKAGLIRDWIVSSNAAQQ